MYVPSLFEATYQSADGPVLSVAPRPQLQGLIPATVTKQTYRGPTLAQARVPAPVPAYTPLPAAPVPAPFQRLAEVRLGAGRRRPDPHTEGVTTRNPQP